MSKPSHATLVEKSCNLKMARNVQHETIMRHPLWIWNLNLSIVDEGASIKKCHKIDAITNLMPLLIQDLQTYLWIQVVFKYLFTCYNMIHCVSPLWWMSIHKYTYLYKYTMNPLSIVACTYTHHNIYNSLLYR